MVEPEDVPLKASVKPKREIEQASHTFKDPGPLVAEADYKPRVYGNPEEIFAAAFLKMGRDYAGQLPADFVLHAVLQSRAGEEARRYASIDAIDGGENTAPRSLR